MVDSQVKVWELSQKEKKLSQQEAPCSLDKKQTSSQPEPILPNST